MQTLNELLAILRGELLASAPLNALAVSLKTDESGTAGFISVQMGNEYVTKTVPLEQVPFFLIVVGSEKARLATLRGTEIRREIRIITWIFDTNPERCTTRIVTFEETLIREICAILGPRMLTEENPTGFITDYAVKPVLSDVDVNRPLAFRTIPVEINYILEDPA